MFGWMSALQPKGTKRMTDTTGAYDGGATGVMSGLIEGTGVATAAGWRPVEAIAVGDKVLTFDAGMQPVTRVERRALWSGETNCPPLFWPLEVPVGAVGNRKAMRLLPNQGVMLESDVAELVYDDPFALLPALALEGVDGVHRVPPRHGIEAVVLYFDSDQVIFADSGMLFFSPSSRDLLDHADKDDDMPLYSLLPLDEAVILAEAVAIEAGATGRQAPATPRPPVASAAA